MQVQRSGSKVWVSRSGLGVVLLVLAGVLSACGSDDDSASREPGAGPLRVVVSAEPLAEAARAVGGDDVDVVNLTPPGSEPHDLELSPDQVVDIIEADIVMVLGQGFQPAVEEAVADRDGPTLVVLDDVELEGPAAVADEHADEHSDEHADEHADEHDHGDMDPHFWLDPTALATVADEIGEALSDADAGQSAAYSQRAAEYRAQLETLDGELSDGLETCERRTIVTAHAAFGWLARRYDLEHLAIAGSSPDQEPSAERIAELADLAREGGVTTIFTEELVSPDVAETLAREAGGLRTAVLDPMESISDDARAEGATYLTIQRANLAALREALDCR